MSHPTRSTSLVTGQDGRSYLVPFILVTSLFFLWGLAHSLLDILNKHFQEILGVTKAQSGLVQTAVYGGYFVMAIPAGLLMKRVGDRNGTQRDRGRRAFPFVREGNRRSGYLACPIRRNCD